MIKLDDYETIHDKDNYSLQSRKTGSLLNKDLALCKGHYKLSKLLIEKEGVDLECIVNAIYNSTERLKWDKSLKSLEILEGDERSCIIRSVIHSPMPMVAERETIDKRSQFFHEGIHYNIATSVPEDVKYC